ncbi:Histone-lysine N-methyltransferase, H3 lysine-79 specific [Balamuthia mandrillaris]
MMLQGKTGDWGEGEVEEWLKKKKSDTERKNDKEWEKRYPGLYDNGVSYHYDLVRIHDELKYMDKIAGSKAHVYGEITPGSVDRIMAKVQLNSKDIFYDLGSGVGKVVIQIGLESPVKKSIGLELSHTRYERAREALSRLKYHPTKHFSKKDLAKVDFREEDFGLGDWKDATVVYMCNTCYPVELIAKVVFHLRLCPNIRYVLAYEVWNKWGKVTSMLEDAGFTLVDRFRVRTSWDAPFLLVFRPTASRKEATRRGKAASAELYLEGEDEEKDGQSKPAPSQRK